MFDVKIKMKTKEIILLKNIRLIEDDIEKINFVNSKMSLVKQIIPDEILEINCIYKKGEL